MNEVELAIACWRLEKWIAELNVERTTAATSSIRQIKKYLDLQNIGYLDYCGQKYDSGLAIDVVGNYSDKDILEEEFVIAETLQPIVLKNGEVIKYGQVMLGETIKEIKINRQKPTCYEDLIDIICTNIEQYNKERRSDQKIKRKLRWCKEKLTKQLRTLSREKDKR